jgi:hypothetical protein
MQLTLTTPSGRCVDPRKITVYCYPIRDGWVASCPELHNCKMVRRTLPQAASDMRMEIALRCGLDLDATLLRTTEHDHLPIDGRTSNDNIT